MFEEGMTVQESIKTYLTREQIADVGTETSHVWQRVENLKAQKKVDDKAYTATLEDLMKEHHELHQQVFRTYRVDVVECIVVYDWKNKMVQFSRKDTGEVVRDQEMGPGELQTKMNFGIDDDIDDRDGKSRGSGK